MRIEWALSPMTGVLIRRGGDTQGRPCDDGGRDGHAAAMNQGTPKFTQSGQQLEDAWKDPFLELPEGAQP